MENFLFDSNPAVLSQINNPKLIMKPIRLILISIVVIALSLVGCSKKKEVVETEQALYEKAHVALQSGRFEAAARYFEDLKSTYPYGTYTTQGEIEACYTYYRTRNFLRAIPCINEFLSLHPTHPHIDYAYYLKGLASLPVRPPKFGENIFKTQEQFSDHDADSARDAYAAFSEVVRVFPFSEYAEASRQHLVNLINTFARYDLQVARFYLHRDAHVAAVNRAKVVLRQYSTSPHTEEALAILVYSYRQIGLDDLAADNKLVLKHNFPNSEFLENEAAVLDEKLIKSKNKRVLFGLFN